MEFSVAMRLGSMASPRGEGETSIDGLARCALGAARLATGDWSCSDNYDEFIERWPWLAAYVECPEAKCRSEEPVVDVIWELNDTHEWSRERIAEWVETIEKLFVVTYLPQEINAPCDHGKHATLAAQ